MTLSRGGIVLTKTSLPRVINKDVVILGGGTSGTYAVRGQELWHGDGPRPRSAVVAVANHSTAPWGQSAEQVQAGFVTDLYALQGHRHTWKTGGLWCSDYSSNVWAFTDTVLPRLVVGI